MPRPKVPPQNRKRALQACLSCRNSKKRCNGQQPCSNCTRKGLTGSCSFEDVIPALVSDQVISPGQRVHSTSNESPNASQTGRLSARNDRSHTRTPATITGTLVSSPEASHMTHPRLLDNLQGVKVFFGGSASLAFLQLIRDTVSQTLGRSHFSHHSERDHMLEEPRSQALPVVEVPLTSEQEHSFLDLFFIATRGLLEFSNKEHILNVVNKYSSVSAPLKSLDIATAQTVLAIGAQCSLRDHVNLTISRSYFAEAQRIAFAGMIEDPSLEMVQLFLLMSFYMLGACHRNAAFMYLGVAARAAYVLGLHYAPAGDEPSTQGTEQKRITWECLVTLDTIVSSILGRPSATSTRPSRPSDNVIVLHGARSLASTAMQANYQLACLLDQKVQELYSSDKVTVEGARLCLNELNAWSTCLPPEVRLASDTVPNIATRERVIGGLHVSCFYYFAVMLVSRPFLIVHLTNRIARSCNASNVAAMESPEADFEAEMQEIATACLNAASYMIQTCVETEVHRLLPDNMRVLKAWVFAAGLVLGFDLFTVNQSDLEIEEAFSGSCNILKALSVHSAQAAHYFDILTSLSDAIADRRRQALSQRKRTKKPIVERIMAFQATQSSHSKEGANSQAGLPNAIIPSTTDKNNNNSDWNTGFAFDFDFQEMMNEPFLNWESADFLSWDPFSRDLPS